ncbi:sugar phosphate isomerase/epimerase family protein [Rubripirellula reticaptiva]|uniref:Inosose dehydratase n=1 Tax=Rubripirellula reticaptiva TaxID=2528013 RepID=A0A5C6F716_9BACT|nr:sugar phosphate isomerase/epimerase [Rubripirellula reticaptiva]TWU57178.1 Inosose dehydratase [Rubripirellula reticaptiva]
MKRRQFLGAVGAGATLVSAPRLLLALDKDNAYRQNIGIQLYTLRNEINEDVRATVKAVADAGYKQVEPYGFPNAAPMIEAARDFGLAINSSHFNSDSIVNNDAGDDEYFETVLEKASDVGLKHLVIPYLPDQFRTSLDDYKRVCQNCNQAAEKAKSAGIQLSYHNHAFEFEPREGGMSGYDVMIDEFSPDMKFEVDVFWVVVGGKNPVELIGKLGNRVSQLHLKDLDASVEVPNYGGIPKEAFKEIGNGVINIEAIIEAAGKAGVAHCHVEQDQSPNPLASIKQSMKSLKQM